MLNIPSTPDDDCCAPPVAARSVLDIWRSSSPYLQRQGRGTGSAGQGHGCRQARRHVCRHLLAGLRYVEAPRLNRLDEGVSSSASGDIAWMGWTGARPGRPVQQRGWEAEGSTLLWPMLLQQPTGQRASVCRDLGVACSTKLDCKATCGALQRQPAQQGAHEVGRSPECDELKAIQVVCVCVCVRAVQAGSLRLSPQARQQQQTLQQALTPTAPCAGPRMGKHTHCSTVRSRPGWWHCRAGPSRCRCGRRQ